MKLHHTPRIALVLGMAAALVAIGMMAAVILTIENPAWAEVKPGSKEDMECAVYAGNPEDCMKFQTFGMRKACLDAQNERYKTCKNVEMESSKKSSTKLPTDAPITPVQPTKAGQNVGKVGGVKKDPMPLTPTNQPGATGGTTVPKTKIGDSVGKVGGVKKDPMNVIPKTKIGESVGKVGGVQKVDQGSASTSGGGTILMQRSGNATAPGGTTVTGDGGTLLPPRHKKNQR